MTRRCDRNRKRSKRRPIYCPMHGCYMDSASRKHTLFADKPEHLQQRGMKRLSALTLIQNYTAVPLTDEWLEAFWCQDCQTKSWYHVRRQENLQSQGVKYHYELSIAPESLWRQASGVIQPGGNPSVGEFTRRAARDSRYQGVRGFGVIG